MDLIEADFCNTEGTNMSALQLYEGARDAIAAATAATGQKMALYQCNWGAEEPWNWAPTVANLFRATGDICSPGRIAFSRILSNFDNTIVHSGTPGMAPGQPGTGIGAWLGANMAAGFAMALGFSAVAVLFRVVFGADAGGDTARREAWLDRAGEAAAAAAATQASTQLSPAREETETS